MNCEEKRMVTETHDHLNDFSIQEENNEESDAEILSSQPMQAVNTDFKSNQGDSPGQNESRK